MRLLGLLFLGLCLNNVLTKVTEKQYASAPEMFYMENYDQCMLLEDKALYCHFTYRLEPINKNSNNSETWNAIQELSSNDMNYRHDLLRKWICVPKSCPDPDNGTETSLAHVKYRIEKCYHEKYSGMGLQGHVEELRCEGNKAMYPVDWIDILVGLAFISYISFVLYATYCDPEVVPRTTESNHSSKNHQWDRVLNSFSIRRNWLRLKAVKESDELERLKPYQGVRFFNTLIVILCHSAIAAVQGPVANVKYMEGMTETIGNLFLSSGPLCVSTFFAISAFFLMIGLLDSFKDKPLELRHLVMIFLNRYVRLVPPLLVVILFNATWWRHLGDGPLWNSLIGLEHQRCRNYGWTNILFINNLIASENMCAPHTWYLAVDTQYFAIMLLLIWFMKKHPRSVYPLLVTMYIVQIIAAFFENYYKGYEALLIPRPELVYEMKNILPNPQWHIQMSGLIGNTAGSITGLYLGYRYLKDRDNPPAKTGILHNYFVYYFLSYGIGLSITLLPGFFLFVLKFPKNPFWASVDVALARPLFTFAIGFGVYQAAFGFGWPAKDVLRWFPACILARLSYSAYLVHVCIVLSKAAVQRYPVYLSTTYIIYQYMSDATIAYIAALLLALFLEMPISDLQNIFLKSQKPEPKTEKKE